jgi:adenosylcobinamide-GDP ribazoletransferase
MRLFNPLADITACLAFLTRIPLGAVELDTGRELARSSWAFGIVGALVGGIGAAVYAIAAGLGLTPLIAATLAVAAIAAATGALHEDGLTDAVDGFGGGHDRAAKLRIMRDSHLGVFAAVALFLILVLRITVLAALADPVAVGSILVAAAAASRTVMVMIMAWLAPARADGLGAASGIPDVGTLAIGVLISIVVTFAIVPAAVAVGILLAVAGGGTAVAWLARRQIGGHTGDVLGAAQQVGEVAALVVAIALS